MNKESKVNALYVHDEKVHNLNAPRIVVPILIDLLKPCSVLDVGCGLGTWLSAFEELGVTDVVGLDGTYVNRNLLKIAEQKFIPTDLNGKWPVVRKFDLVISLEVAEHLPESEADAFVAQLCAYADTIVFSAAIPGQFGQHHLNEQWPEYWQRKFEKHNYYFHDEIRSRIWNNSSVDFWYKQNMFIVRKGIRANESTLALVHPEMLSLVISNHEELKQSLAQGKQGLKLSAKIFINSLFYKIKSIVTGRV